MKSTRLVMLLGLFSMLTTAEHLEAGCSCTGFWPEACDAVCTRFMASFTLTEVPGSVIVDYPIETSGIAGPLIIGSCPSAGAQPVEKTCVAVLSVTSVRTWQISGNVGPQAWGLASQYGETKTVTAGCGNTQSGSRVTIKSWCSCCLTRAGLKYKITTKQFRCAPPEGYTGGARGLPTSCDDPAVTSSLKEFQNVVCDELPCEIPSPCNPICPPPI